jgi:hypothetical protein
LDKWVARSHYYDPYDAVDPNSLVYEESTDVATVDWTAAVSETGATYNG